MRECAVLASSRRRPGHHGVRHRRRECREPCRRGRAESGAQVGGHRGRHGGVVLHLAVVAGAGEVAAGRRGGGGRGAVAEPGVEGLEEIFHARACGTAPVELALSPRLQRQLPVPRLDVVLLERDWPGYL